ncbi:DUF6259 domain-containing protein [Flexilinea flocculi]|uniref:DUF6259 domain-containing protein n=1 Tax=Flexilinea flocculi TaxID=1678840 RepID=A0A0S7BT98_9CHLR|nr:DUF6259 domain-containing protein [Flexilinea flocculi]GAP40246.1 hypothetical protein ATC1_13213 [Flexilinea flocculi]
MYRIENSKLRVIFSEKMGLQEIYDKVAGRNYIDSDSNSPLFCIELSEIYNGIIQKGSISVTSFSANKTEVNEKNGNLEIKFFQLDSLDIDVICKIRLEEITGLSYWTIKIQNQSPFAVRSVNFPLICAIAPLSGNGTNDRILLPKADGYLLPSPLVSDWEGDYPHRRFNQRFAYPGEGREFPENICCQLLAYYDNNGGLYIATYDGNGHPKRLGPIIKNACQNLYLDFSPEHLFSEKPCTDCEVPYETVVGCFSGNWQDAAALYKRWAIKQNWCTKILAQRDDVPDWVKKGAFFLNFRLRYQKEGENYLRKVPEFCKEWQSYLNMPIVAMMVGWEKNGEWVGLDYFPLYGDQENREMCISLKIEGIIPFHFGLSGLKLPIRKRIGKDATQPELSIDYNNRQNFDKNYRSQATIDSDGNVMMDSNISSWDGLHGYACVSTHQAYTQIVEAANRLVEEYDSVVVQADQIFGGAVPECYSAEHGHPLGRGKWQVDCLRNLYQTTRKTCKEKNRDFALSQEFPSELFIQDLDICHGRVSDQPRGIWGVPLFTFLYHEYLSCYGGDWSSLLPDDTCGIYTQANNFVFGSQCAGSPQTAYKDPTNKEPQACSPEIMNMAKQTCTLFQKYTKYLVFGKMIRTYNLDVPDTEVVFVGMDFSGWKKKPIKVPSILNCAWMATDGKIAFSLSNISDKEIIFTVPNLGGTQKAIIETCTEKIQLFADGDYVLIKMRSNTAAILEFE